MFQLISNWFKRNFSNPEAVALFLTIIFAIVFITLLGGLLAPVIASIIIAYLLDSIVKLLQRWKCPHLLAVILVCLLAIGLILSALLVLMPMLWHQLSNLINESPHIFSRAETLLAKLPQLYPNYISADQINHIVAEYKTDVTKVGQIALSFSLSSIPGLIELVVYAVLVPLLVFFFLKDKDAILHWFARFLPRKHQAIQTVWSEVNQQIANYIRGRVVEIIIIGTVSCIIFSILGLKYALLIGATVGLAVIVPYIGVIVATIPVVLVGFWQWGFSSHFLYLLIAYAIITVLDSNVLVPLLFSETMKLHPVAIIVAVFIFGGVWGFWGVFFAIPLATVVKAVINAWPSVQQIETY